MSIDRLRDRFLSYVAVDTTAVDETGKYPSSPGQLTLGRQLVEELKAIGLADAAQDENGLVLATVPPSPGCENAPVVVLNAHLDTSPETPGANIQPQVIENYAGGDIPLPGDPDKVITVEQNPELKKLVGTTIITTDGTTLLGADDKSGVAVIMETAERLMHSQEAVNGPVKILFTCDEEIGRGVDFVDIPALGASVCYTLDGGAANEINLETFSADLAIVTVKGINIHPSIAKDKMVNAIRAAGEFLARMPRERLSPECTEGRDGFLHPYGITGGVAEATIRVLLRDFDTAELAVQADLLRETAADVEQAFPGCSISVEVRQQYRNMAEGLVAEPRAAEYARRAIIACGGSPREALIRGGTDGSRFTELGLPAPNMSSGQHTPHSPLEWASLDQMEHAVAVTTALLREWANG